jgi:hypothetical protein
METPVRTIAKKVFSLALVFNALISFTCVAGILFGYYRIYPTWRPFAPYFLDGNLFWLVLAAALINIFPSAAIGRALHTGRFLFHHYVYGAFVLAFSSVFVVAFTPVSLFSLFFVDDSSIVINASRIFLLAGLTLFIDDLPDVSTRIESVLNRMKWRAYQIRKAFHALQWATGFVTLYGAVAVLVSTIQTGERTAPNAILAGTLFVSGITSLALAKRKAWLNITISKPNISPIIEPTMGI